MLLFSHYASARWAWVPGAIFIVGRQLYAWEYLRDPKSRGPGMGITLTANAILLGGALVGVALRLLG